MIENRAEQVEALQALLDYNPKLVRAMRAVAQELAGEKREDTAEYLKVVINGMNWEIEVINGTMEVLNEQETVIDKKAANDVFVSFSSLYKTKDEQGMAACLTERIIPFFELCERQAEKVK